MQEVTRPAPALGTGDRDVPRDFAGTSGDNAQVTDSRKLEIVESDDIPAAGMNFGVPVTDASAGAHAVGVMTALTQPVPVFGAEDEDIPLGLADTAGDADPDSDEQEAEDIE